MPISPLQIPNAPKPLGVEDENDPLNPQIPTPEAIDPEVTPAAATGIAPEVPAAAQPLSAIATPTRTDIDPSKDTVEGRVADIVSKGGPLQQIARTQSQQRMQQKGLLNTSMAIGAGQKAVMEQALSIAKPDALYAQQINLQREKEGIDKRMLTASADEQIRLIAKKGELDTKLQEISGAQSLEQIGARGEVETGLIDRRGEIEKELQTADAENRSTLLQEQGKIDLELVVARGAEEISIRERQSELDTEMLTMSEEFKSAAASEQAKLAERMQELQADQRLVLQKLQGDQSIELADLNAFYDVQINTQRSSAALYNTTQQTIAELLVNPDITPTERTNAIQYQLDNLNASLSVLGVIGGVDISSILDTITPATTEEGTTTSTTGTPPTITAGMSLTEVATAYNYVSIRGGNRDPGTYIHGGVNGEPFKIRTTNETIKALEDLDPNESAEHEDTDRFIPGFGWVPASYFINP